jgi:hypothetical protein
MMGCSQCDNREICAGLCPAAEAYTDQDYVPRREMILDRVWIEERITEEEPERSVRPGRATGPIQLSKREWQVVTVLILTKKIGDKVNVCEVLGISMRNLDIILHRLKKKLILT